MVKEPKKKLIINMKFEVNLRRKLLATSVCVIFMLINQPKEIESKSVMGRLVDNMNDQSSDNKWMPIRSFKMLEVDRSGEKDEDKMKTSESSTRTISSDNLQSQQVTQSERKLSPQFQSHSTNQSNIVKQKLSSCLDDDKRNLFQNQRLVAAESVLNEVNAPVSNDDLRRMMEMNDYGDNSDDNNGEEDEQASGESNRSSANDRFGGNGSLESAVSQRDRYRDNENVNEENENNNYPEQADSHINGNNLGNQAPEQGVQPGQSEELSEAEAADRSALDEQQQQQREIIMAQARSEAKAIKEQQESLLRQQKLQQQMVLRRHDFNKNHTDSYMRGKGRATSDGERLSSASSSERRRPGPDILFSDHPNHHDKPRSWNEENSNEMAEYSALQPALSLVKIGGIRGGDLESAAQHHYGSHYGSLNHGHHGDYFQFAESHKKGQFDSGFKRGNKKFHISGHSSQHKSHAEGHVKWHGKKGKGSQYWDLKHKNKKGHGYGYGYH